MKADARWQPRVGELRGRTDPSTQVPGGAAPGVLDVQCDLPERQRAEMHLRMLSRAVEQSPASIVITDLQARIEYVNPKFTAVTGYTLEEARGRNPRILKSGKMHPRDYATLWATLREGQEWCGEFENRKKNGELYWELASISPIADAAGRITHYVAVKEDITERKRAEAALQETNQRLEEATAKANELALQAELASISKSQFLANMSHEIRTPMSGILGMTGLLLDTELTPDQRQYATLVRNSGQALLTVINDILDFSKIEAGRLELDLRDFDLRALLEDTTDLLAVRAAEKVLPLVSLMDPGVPIQLHGDPDRVRQILLNLGGNAIKFTARGDVVCRVSVDHATDALVTLRFAITDTGIGIPAERQQDLFKPFSQVDGSTTRKYGGTGLGLAISRQLATLMGGQAGCLSEPGQGSTFWFTANFTRPAVPAPEERPLNLPNPPPLVLVADPHAATRESLRQPLRAWGFAVEVVPDGPKAWSRLREAAAAGAPFHIAFLSSELQIAEGHPLLQALADDPALNPLHRVRLTTFGRRPSLTAAPPESGVHQLSKPVHHTDLRNIIHRLLHPAAPEARSAPVPATTTTPTVAPARTRLRLLLVEDNATNQRVAVGILNKLGCQIDVAANGREALTALGTQPYDLVLMDCQMPEMDGFEATRQIRRPDSDVPNPSIPVIAMTAHAMDGDRQKCLAAGMDDYLTKPIDPAILAATLDRWADKLASSMAPPTPELLAPSPQSPASGPQPRAPSPQSPTQVFDRTGFLRRVMGDTELARGLAVGFLTELPDLVRRFQEAVNTRDLSSALQHAHRLKGSSANMGGVALHTIAAAAETAAKTGQLQTLVHLAPELAREAERLHATLHGVWPGAPVP